MKKALLFAGLFVFALMMSCGSYDQKSTNEAEASEDQATEVEVIEEFTETDDGMEGDTIVMDDAALPESE
jgi:hypothetical protein